MLFVGAIGQTVGGAIEITVVFVFVFERVQEDRSLASKVDAAIVLTH